MPLALTDQTDAIETATQALLALSDIAFTSIEQLSALNLRMARATLSDAVAASELLGQPAELPFLKRGESPLSGPAARKVVAYLSDAQGIAADSQDGINRLISAYFSLNGQPLAPGKTWSSGFDLFTRIAQQASSLAAANARAVGLNTERLLAVAAAQAK